MNAHCATKFIDKKRKHTYTNTSTFFMNMEIFMSKVAELKARIAADQQALAEALKEERADALKRIRQEIKDFGFKTTDFKGVLATRKKRVTSRKSAFTKK